MDDLAQFLRARLDEDEQTARRAGDSFRQIGKTGVIVSTEGDRAEECATANWAGIAEHIVRHDPARVLAEVDAKRQLIDWVLRWPMRPHAPSSVDGILERLALPYADHADYRDEWRP
ncbi:DUF6221 family protein [Streptomyces sp. NPDC057271]|uniref:DUF6221 family protein n=1 Tax=unclassified Streptomyces TaxID=2593676 RepID=UPI00363D0843